MADIRRTIEKQQRQIDQLTRDMFWVKRGTTLWVDGSKALEELWQFEVETEGGGGFAEVKLKAGHDLAKEVAEFLGYGFPAVLGPPPSEMVDGSPEWNRFDLVQDFCRAIRKPRLVVNVHARPAYEGGEKVGRVRGCFRVQIDFGNRHGIIKEAILDGLTALLREKSGEEVWDDGLLGEQLGIAVVPRPVEGGGSAGGAAGTDVVMGVGGGAAGSAADLAGGPPEVDLGDTEEGEPAAAVAAADCSVLGSWLSVHLPPARTRPSRREENHGRNSKGRSSKGSGKSTQVAPGAVPKAGAQPAAASKGKGKGDKGTGKDKPKGKAKGKGKATKSGRRPAVS